MPKKKPDPRVIVVMPAYNAEKTLQKTYTDLPKDLISEIILVDDKSTDNTVEIAEKLGLIVFAHEKNMGYGANQKTCYREALKRKADIVVMVHPDYQYDATLTSDLVQPIVDKRFDMMFGSRIRTRREALAGGMPLKKYLLNRVFCALENIILGANFTEYFSGMRAYSKEVLQKIPYEKFSNDFVFDQQMMLIAYAHNYRIGEINIPVRYFSESSSIGSWKGLIFLVSTCFTLIRYTMYIFGYRKDMLFHLKS